MNEKWSKKALAWEKEEVSVFVIGRGMIDRYFR